MTINDDLVITEKQPGLVRVSHSALRVELLHIRQGLLVRELLQRSRRVSARAAQARSCFHANGLVFLFFFFVSPAYPNQVKGMV